jgi:hypothetical protein
MKEWPMANETETASLGADILNAVAPFVDGLPSELVVEAMAGAMLATVMVACKTPAGSRAVLQRYARKIEELADGGGRAFTTPYTAPPQSKSPGRLRSWLWTAALGGTVSLTAAEVAAFLDDWDEQQAEFARLLEAARSGGQRRRRRGAV